jgi:hypothetical protein
MKHVSQIPAGKNAADVDASNDQTEHEPEPVAEVDSIIEDIQMRANYVGPVLEEILHLGHERMSWAS